MISLAGLCRDRSSGRCLLLLQQKLALKLLTAFQEDDPSLLLSLVPCLWLGGARVGGVMLYRCWPSIYYKAGPVRIRFPLISSVTLKRRAPWGPVCQNSVEACSPCHENIDRLSIRSKLGILLKEKKDTDRHMVVSQGALMSRSPLQGSTTNSKQRCSNYRSAAVEVANTLSHRPLVIS